MAPRAFGALLALVAALLFATALAGGLVPTIVPGWWDGHPIVEGKVRELKVIHVGLLDAQGCNLGEEVKCEPLDTNHRLEPLSYGELGALGIGSLTMLLLALSAWKVGDRRKGLAKVALIEVLVIGAGAAAIFFIRGPDLDVQIRLGLPVNLGLFAAAGGCGAGFLASLIARKIEPEPLRLKSSEPRLAHPQHQQQPAFDVRELLRDSQHRMAPMPPSPGGPLPGPSGPLGGQMQTPSGGHVHGAQQPLFETAPQLRPLYDLHAAQSGFAMPPPLEAVTPPTRGAAYEDRGDSAAAHLPVAAFGAEPYVPPARSIERTEDIPLERDSYDPMPPPSAFGAAVPGSFGAPQPPPFSEPTTPPNRHARPGTNVRKAAAAVGGPARAARPSVPPRITGTHRPTISAPVPPMPSAHAEPPEPSTSVEIDAEAKARAQAGGDRPSEQAMTMPVDRSDHTDESVIAAPVARGDHPTDQNAFVPTGDSTAETQAPESFEDLETRDAKKFSEDELANAHTELGPFGQPPPRASSELPTKASPKVDIELPTAPARDSSPAVVVDAMARGESPARSEREAAPPAPDQTIDRDDVIAPPPPASAAPPLPPQKAGPPSPPPARPRRVSGAPPPTNAAAVPVASFAIAPSAANPLPRSNGKPTEPPPPLLPKSAPIAPAPQPPPAAPEPAASPLAGPQIASVPKGPLPSIAKPNVPLPRTLKPSVPPPASKFGGISTKNPVEPKAPFMPSNLAAAASANKATTTSTPAPFATIPSPFAKPIPAPSDGAHEAATKPAPANLLNEAPTVPSTKPGLDAKLGEAPTVPARIGEAPTVPARPAEPDSNEGATVRKSEPKVAAPAAPARPTPVPRAPDPTRSTGANVPISTAPTSLPPPKQAPQVSSGPTPACPQCEAPMAWVEEHLRFYCASCRMYF